MFILLFLSSCIVSVYCRDLKELKHPSFNAETYTDQYVDGIVGGEEALIEDYPHQVAFFIEKDFYCGGFIISENFILTAAHCIAGVVAEIEKEVRAGSAFRKNGTIFPIAEAISHPKYSYTRHDYDVAVLKTKDKIEFNDVIQAIPLPKKGREMVNGTDVVVSGWGKIQEDGYGSNHLMAVKTPVVDQDQCKESYGERLTKNMFCAGNWDLGGMGACIGDSGGPVQQDGMAVGIVSWSKGCARPKYPTVYVNIAAPAI